MKLRIRLFCTASIFLCALCSVRAQQPTGLSAAVDWASRAVDCERRAWNAADLQELNEALLEKAHCCMQLSRWEDACEALSRVRMFALSPEEAQELLYKRELCLFLGGEFEQAAALVSELELERADVLLLHALVLAYAGRYDESELWAARYVSWNGENPRLPELLKFYEKHPRERREGSAMALSFFPPLGHFYNGAYAEGLLSLGLNAAAAAFTVANLLGGYWVSGIIGGGMALNATFMGNQERNAFLVEKNNRNAALEFGDALRQLLLSFD